MVKKLIAKPFKENSGFCTTIRNLRLQNLIKDELQIKISIHLINIFLFDADVAEGD